MGTLPSARVKVASITCSPHSIGVHGGRIICQIYMDAPNGPRATFTRALGGAPSDCPAHLLGGAYLSTVYLSHNWCHNWFTNLLLIVDCTQMALGKRLLFL
jgi:hypothetical protein